MQYPNVEDFESARQFAQVVLIVGDKAGTEKYKKIRKTGKEMNDEKTTEVWRCCLSV